MYMRKDASNLKMERIKGIAAIIAAGLNKDKKVNIETAIDQIEYKIGLSRTKGFEYISLICRVHGWDMLEGNITLPK